jgi:hypothetical protein
MAEQETLLSDNLRDPHDPDIHRDPESRPVNPQDRAALRDKMLDKTLADSYPASDPPSTLPDPAADDSLLLDDEADEAA